MFNDESTKTILVHIIISCVKTSSELKYFQNVKEIANLAEEYSLKT